MFYVSPSLTAMMLAIIPPVSIGAVVYGRYIKKLSNATQEAIGEMTKVPWPEEYSSFMLTAIPGCTGGPLGTANRSGQQRTEAGRRQVLRTRRRGTHIGSSRGPGIWHLLGSHRLERQHHDPCTLGLRRAACVKRCYHRWRPFQHALLLLLRRLWIADAHVRPLSPIFEPYLTRPPGRSSRL